MRDHNTTVNAISKQVKTFYERQVPFRVYHGSTNSTRHVKFDKDKIVDISALSSILSINRESHTALVEPKVSMAQLVKETLKFDMMPAVVPEFPGITAGGAFAGTAAESSSWKFGYFDRSVHWIEVVLGDGEVVRASPKENAELFYASAGAMGTFGITTLLEVQLIPCGKYIKLEYHPVTSAQEAVEKIALLGTTNIDFLDGIMFSEEVGMLVTGQIVREQPNNAPVVSFTRARDRWFFTHVHGKLKCPKGLVCLTCHWTKRSFNYAQKDKVMTELAPVNDYLFRYDRGSFWLGTYGWAPNLWNRVSRVVMNPIFKTDFAYRVLHLAGTNQQCIIQDLAIPEERIGGFLQFVEQRLKIYPLWLCPIRYSPDALMHTAKTQLSAPRYLINIGVWGVPNLGDDAYTRETVNKFVEDNRAIENKLAETGGLKWLYAQSMYTEDEFWRVYDKERYQALREQWKAQTLPSVWDKVKGGRKEWRAVNVWKGIFYAMLKKDYLI